MTNEQGLFELLSIVKNALCSIPVVPSDLTTAPPPSIPLTLEFDYQISSNLDHQIRAEVNGQGSSAITRSDMFMSMKLI